VAKITKFIPAVAGAIVVVLAVLAAMLFGLLAGALVVLVAGIATFSVVRFRVAREEKAGNADWAEVLGASPDDDTMLNGWVPAPARSGRLISDPSVFALPTERDASNGFEALTDDALSSHAANGSPTAWTPNGATSDEDPVSDWSVPSDWSVFPGRPDSASSKERTPVEGEGIPLAPPGTERTTDGHRGGDTEPPHGFAQPAPSDDPGDADSAAAPTRPDPPDLDPVDAPQILHPAEAMSFAGAVAQNGDRPSLIDWSGPTPTIDERVRSADDIMEASAATALPTAGDRPAPAAGSELARLLSKVEARLRDYE